MMVTEFSRRTQGFLVTDVDRITRVDWDQVKPSGEHAGRPGGHRSPPSPELKTAAWCRFSMSNSILVEVFGEPLIPTIAADETANVMTVFFVDDSSVARKEIVSVLDRLGVRYPRPTTACEAWERLQGHGRRHRRGRHQAVAESDPADPDRRRNARNGRLCPRPATSRPTAAFGHPRGDALIAVLEANRAMGRSVGVDAYVAKFDPAVLADTLLALL
jgi:two-component system chemotaxis response regulator CheV